jgi:release factor family 2
VERRQSNRGRQVDAELVALTGDVRAVQLLQATLPKEVAALVQVLDGSRSVDGSPGVASQQLNTALAAVSAHDTTVLLDKLAEEQGQNDRGAQGAKATAALAMAQVQVLLVHDDPTDARIGWFGSDPTLVALTAEKLRDLGSTSRDALSTCLSAARWARGPVCASCPRPDASGRTSPPSCAGPEQHIDIVEDTMPKPQELRRSDYGATGDDSAKMSWLGQ